MCLIFLWSWLWFCGRCPFIVRADLSGRDRLQYLSHRFPGPVGIFFVHQNSPEMKYRMFHQLFRFQCSCLFPPSVNAFLRFWFFLFLTDFLRSQFFLMCFMFEITLFCVSYFIPVVFSYFSECPSNAGARRPTVRTSRPPGGTSTRRSTTFGTPSSERARPGPPTPRYQKPSPCSR